VLCLYASQRHFGLLGVSKIGILKNYGGAGRITPSRGGSRPKQVKQSL